MGIVCCNGCWSAGHMGTAVYTSKLQHGGLISVGRRTNPLVVATINPGTYAAA
jgi:hypothetical protein